jgi:hypothetical protein
MVVPLQAWRPMTIWVAGSAFFTRVLRPLAHQFQIEELVGEVQVNYEKQKFLEQTLHLLKSTLDNLKSTQVEKEVRTCCGAVAAHLHFFH